MQVLSFLYPAFLTLLMLAPDAVQAVKKTPKDAILLSNVKSLTLYANKKTSHRRVPAVPQLTCQGPGCKHYKIDIMRCTNQGADYSAEDIQWSCTASLPEEFKLGSTEVICEGYDNAEDQRVLKGSCGVEYRLLLTDKGEEKYGTTWWGGSKSKQNPAPNSVEDGSVLGKALFMMVFIGVAIWILYSIYQAYITAPNAPRRPRQPHAGGGWGGWGGGDDPPPPYDPYPRKRYSDYGAQEGWRPGFWTGAASGAAAGYMAGRGQRQQAQPVQTNNGWFGGGGGESSTRPSRSSGGSSSSGSGSSARYESTGFGSTSRR